MKFQNPIEALFDDPSELEEDEFCPHCDESERKCDCYEDEELDNLLSDFEDVQIEGEMEGFMLEDDVTNPYQDTY